MGRPNTRGMSAVPVIKIEEQEYDTEDMSEDALAQLRSIEFVDQEMVRLNSMLASMQTARNAYIIALREILDATD